MDIFVRILVEMAQWSRRRPSRALILTICVVAAAIAVIVGVERLAGWPEMLTVSKLPRNPALR